MKDFRTFTHAIPLTEKTTVLFSEEGFANTVEDKIALAREAADYCGEDDDVLRIAWPGGIETHVFLATPRQVLDALRPKYTVGDLVRVTKVYQSGPKVGTIGVIRTGKGIDAGRDEYGVEFIEKFALGHTLDGPVKVRAGRGWYIPASHFEALK